jgi:protein-S-isoprenylcysteine O-methyltransferase Ste14
MLIGLAIIFGSDWTFVTAIPAALVIHNGVVLREERYLDRKFGEDYRRYVASVPRYGWPF